MALAFNLDTGERQQGEAGLGPTLRGQFYSAPGTKAVRQADTISAAGSQEDASNPAVPWTRSTC